MKIDFTSKELELLKESLSYAMMSFDSRSSPHLASQENYGMMYRKKKEALEAMMEKIKHANEK